MPRVEGRREGQSRRPSWGLAAFGAHRKLELLAAEGRLAVSPTDRPAQAYGGHGKGPQAPLTAHFHCGQMMSENGAGDLAPGGGPTE
jgi:hypothetical protein